MEILIKTADGRTLDLSQVKYMSIENVNYALVPVMGKIQPKLKVPHQNKSLEDFFDVSDTPRKKGEKVNSTAYKVRQWLESNPQPGSTINFAAPSDYAIRVAAESKNSRVRIRKLRRGLYNVTFERNQIYARSAYR